MEHGRVINQKARIIAQVTGIINISIYLFLILVFFFSFKTFDRLLDYWNEIALLAYGSFAISLITACSFTITVKEKKAQVAFMYTALIIINLLTFIVYYGLSDFGKGDSWLH